jgi:hypothetical protein
MTLPELYPRLTEAIVHAERLEDEGRTSEARAAYVFVSMLEEEVVRELPASDPEGVLARRGAVRAALKAQLFVRAAELAGRYVVEVEAAQRSAAELRAMEQEARVAFEAQVPLDVRVVSTARYRIRDDAA